MSQKPEFDVNCIYQYIENPNTKVFYKTMVNRGHKMNLKDKQKLEQCENKIQRYGKRKDIFVSDNIDCHNFYCLLADKYNIDYISYLLIFNSLDTQLLKNMYRHVWVQWHELSDSVCKFIDENDDLEFNNSEEHDNVEDLIELIHYTLGHKFKYNPEHIDDIYDNNKVRIKILDSFYRFCKKRELYANFVLKTMQQYFMD